MLKKETTMIHKQRITLKHADYEKMAIKKRSKNVILVSRDEKIYLIN